MLQYGICFWHDILQQSNAKMHAKNHLTAAPPPGSNPGLFTFDPSMTDHYAALRLSDLQGQFDSIGYMLTEICAAIGWVRFCR